MKAVYFVTESGRRPAEEFVKSLNVHSREKFFSVIELLEEFRKGLSFPHAKYMGDEIFELRFGSVEGSIRVLYFFFDAEKAVLTNGFVKKSNKTPKSEKETAVGRREIYFKAHKGGTS
ncbi:MAG: type II toxin-antitoxin system RelE/ParE family toxin [Candidatus Omnitrophota bacterium]|nr:type II toxin-antitoxin system RelE/ParE family toxin [Candidatus Omnitrophota bacterium]